MDVNPTVVGAVRREQIAKAAIEVMGRFGYARTTFAKVTAQAGLSSTRMVSYHFADKNDLMVTVLGIAIGAADELMEARTAGTTDRVAMLRGYIESQVDLLRVHPEYARAIVEIGLNARDESGAAVFEPVLRDFRVGRLERQLRQGQAEGVFARFDPVVMAQTIRSAVDGAGQRREADPGVDLESYGRELADTFERAVRV